MVHDVSSHDVLESTDDLRSLVVGSNVHLPKYDAEPWGWNYGVVHFTRLVVDEVCESSLEILAAVEVEHAGEETAMIQICGVHPVCVGAKVVPLPAYVLAEPKPRVESVHLPGSLERLHSLRSVLLDSFPEKLGQLRVVGHEPIVPPVVVHEAVALCSLVADLLRGVHHRATLVRSEGVVQDDSQSSEEALAPRRSVRGRELVAELGEHQRRALLRVSVVVEHTHAGEKSGAEEEAAEFILRCIGGRARCTCKVAMTLRLPINSITRNYHVIINVDIYLESTKVCRGENVDRRH